VIGEWVVHDGPVEICKTGLHYSRTILAALEYAPGAVLHRVEAEDVVEEIVGDKGVARRRRVLASADMMWALVEFAENCASRAASGATSIAASGAGSMGVAGAASMGAASAAAGAASRAASMGAAGAAAGAASRAASRTAAKAAAWAAADWAAERNWQNETLALWFECLSGCGDGNPRSALDGWKAAALIVRRALDDAQKNRPRRRSWKMQRLAAYREGYYAGLLLAHGQHALGEFPGQNADAIRDALKPNVPLHFPTEAERKEG